MSLQKLIREGRELLEAKYINPNDYKYKGGHRHWVHMLYADDNVQKRTPKVKNPISVSSTKRVISPELVGGGRRGIVFRGKPSHHFPFDAHSTRGPKGAMRLSKRRANDTKRYRGEHDEAWLVPSKSKVVGHLYHSDAKNKKEFSQDKAGVKFLHRSPGHAYVHLKTGKTRKLNRDELAGWHSKHFPEKP